MESLSEYMERALFNSIYGFYENESLEDHFITPSTLKTRYHEFLIKWIIKNNFRSILELGPGSARFASALKTYSDLSYLGVDRSKNTINRLKEQFKEYSHVSFSNDTVDSYDCIFVQEIFDCCPVNICEYFDDKIFEWMRDSDGSIKKSQLTNSRLEEYAKRLKKSRSISEESFCFVDVEPHQHLITWLFKRTRQYCVIVDYGQQEPQYSQLLGNHSPVRAFRNHQLFHNQWNNPGQYDLTYDVNFTNLSEQWIALGGRVNYFASLAEFLIEKLDWHQIDPFSQERMLFDPRQLGSVFSVLILSKA